MIEVVRLVRVVGLVCNLQNLQQIEPDQQVVKQLSQFANLQNKLFATTICKKSCPKQQFAKKLYGKIIRKIYPKNSRTTICKKGVKNDNCKKKVGWNNYM